MKILVSNMSRTNPFVFPQNWGVSESANEIQRETPDIPAPEIGVEPDGEVVFEWYGGKRKVFSISMGSRNELTYAGLYGISKTFGVEQFYGNIPDTLLDNVSRVFPRRV